MTRTKGPFQNGPVMTGNSRRSRSLVALLTIILTISCAITGKLPLFCNPSTFAFLTIGGADIILDQRLQLEYLPNLAFGAVLFWIVPWLILKLKSRASQDTVT